MELTELRLSLTSTQHSLGQGLHRMIDMLNSVRDLVAEADRHTALLEDGEEGAFTEEYGFFNNKFSLEISISSCLHSDNRLFHAYEELCNKMPSLKHLLDQQEDPELLEMFYKNVRSKHFIIKYE